MIPEPKGWKIDSVKAQESNNNGNPWGLKNLESTTFAMH